MFTKNCHFMCSCQARNLISQLPAGDPVELERVLPVREGGEEWLSAQLNTGGLAETLVCLRGIGLQDGSDDVGAVELIARIKIG